LSIFLDLVCQNIFREFLGYEKEHETVRKDLRGVVSAVFRFALGAE
jgi:hypothetical protein